MWKGRVQGGIRAGNWRRVEIDWTTGQARACGRIAQICWGRRCGEGLRRGG